MRERSPLTSSVTQPDSGEVPPEATSHETANPRGYTESNKRYEQSEKGKARRERYRKSEKGKKVSNKGAKKWNDAHRATGVKRGSPEFAAKISDGVTAWWQRRKQSQENQEPGGEKQN